MNINISKTMDKESHGNEQYEHRIVRIPAFYRYQCNLNIGDFIHLRTRDGKLTTLQVAQAFIEDIIGPMHAYVTTQTYNTLATIDSAAADLNIVRGITLGCDPEVFLINRRTGSIVGAHRFFRKYGPVGHDGYVLEFRPRPSVYAEEVCDTLWGLITQAREMLDAKPEGQDVDIVACSGHSSGLTSGFHLHYGFPSRLLGYSRVTRRAVSIMNSAFDYYVGVPSIIPEGNRDTSRRTVKHLQYGKPGEFRLDKNTYEFRMPGGINMCHPILAQGLLGLGATMAEDIVSRVNTCTDCFTNLIEMTSSDLGALYPNLPDIETFYNIICNPDIGAARAHFEVIKDDVRKMVGYPERAHIIEPYFEALDQDIVFGNNVEYNWRNYYNARQPREMVVL
jgi:hypothetical protein